MRFIIEQVEADQLAHGEIRQGTASAGQIARTRGELRARFGATLPQAYATFLSRMNGLDYNGLVLYGTWQAPDSPGPGGFWQGLVAANAAWREVPGSGSCIVLGETDMDMFTVAPDGSGPVLRDKISGAVNERFSTVAQGVQRLLTRRL